MVRCQRVAASQAPARTTRITVTGLRRARCRVAQGPVTNHLQGSHVHHQLWEHTFDRGATVLDHPRASRARARQHDPAAFRRAARDFPAAVTLADAPQVLLLMLEADDPVFDAAAVRWINRLTGECRGVALTEVHAAVEALEGLPDAGRARDARRAAEAARRPGRSVGAVLARCGGPLGEDAGAPQPRDIRPAQSGTRVGSTTPPGGPDPPGEAP